MSLAAYVDGVGILGPGLADWRSAAAVLSDRTPYEPAATILSPPATLPAAERRRAGRVVKLAIGVAIEATTNAAADPATLPSVFASSGADGQNCHAICVALAAEGRELSPTRFSHSVHNVAAGYWSIATGAMAASTVLSAFDGSFAAGMLEAVAQVAVTGRAVLLVAYDCEYPEPLHSKRPIPDAFGIGLVLAPARSLSSLARIEAALTDHAPEVLSDVRLEALRRSIPAARGLSVLRRLALRTRGAVVVDYLAATRLRLTIDPCERMPCEPISCQ
jgi:hypothetical protein